MIIKDSRVAAGGFWGEALPPAGAFWGDAIPPPTWSEVSKS